MRAFKFSISDNVVDLLVNWGVKVYLLCTRADVKKVVTSSEQQAEQQLDFSTSRKTKRLYALVPERWHLASKISPADFRESEDAFKQLEMEEDCDKKIGLLDACRDYLQIQFRTMDPANHVKSFKNFWGVPHGPMLLSACFEWATGGSRDGSLRETMVQNSDSVFNMVLTVLSEMKGEAWFKKFEEEENSNEAKFGNETMTRINILRDLAKTWKNQAELILFVEGVDDISKISNQPFLHVATNRQIGEGDFDEKINISLRVGTTIVFDDVSLVGGLASLIELIFVFNLMYPPKSDDTFQFIQRILGNFGPSDGARNEQGKIKKCFIDFQCTIGRLMMDRKKAKSVKTFAV